MTPTVVIYTDGACSGNPGPGGWAAILIADRSQKEISGGFRLTTNNRMELMAVIKGLEALKVPCNVTVYTDSEYVAHPIKQHWILRWANDGWRTSTKKPVANQDLWKRLLELMKVHSVTFEHVPGHAGHSMNERCDVLAVAAAQDPQEIDEGFEKNKGMIL